MRSIFYEVIADRSKGINLLAQREFFLLRFHNNPAQLRFRYLSPAQFQFFPHHVRTLGYGLSDRFYLEHSSNVSFRGDDETQCVHL